MTDFLVLGLPRSATTWLSVWLTTEHSLCLHDPFADGLPEQWPRDHRRFGISCTGAYLLPRWLAQQTGPVAVIERDPAACERSLPGAAALAPALARVEGRRFRFDALWDEDSARELWAFLLPAVPFDALRYRQLRGIQIQPHLGKWRASISVITEMQRREAGGLSCPGV